MSKKAKRILLALLVVLGAGALVTVTWFRSLSHELPMMHPSDEADALARSMMASVNHEAWLETGVVEWTFRGQHVHRWDRERNLALVAWEIDGDDGPSLMEVFFDLDSRDGIVLRDREELSAEGASNERSEALVTAWELWVNDSFWLNPIAKVFDEGTTRGLVTPEAIGALGLSEVRAARTFAELRGDEDPSADMFQRLADRVDASGSRSIPNGDESEAEPAASP